MGPNGMSVQKRSSSAGGQLGLPSKKKRIRVFIVGYAWMSPDQFADRGQSSAVLSERRVGIFYCHWLTESEHVKEFSIFDNASGLCKRYADVRLREPYICSQMIAEMKSNPKKESRLYLFLFVQLPVVLHKVTKSGLPMGSSVR